MSKPVFCDHCKKPIEDKDELVTATYYFRIKPFHFRCFEKYIKHSAHGAFTYRQINGTTGNISFLLTIVLALIVTVIGQYSWIRLFGILILTYSLTNRLLSYVLYENRLKSS